jgi:hypothetical protein
MTISITSPYHFHSRHTYLMARRQWSADYQAACKARRLRKLEAINLQRAGEVFNAAYVQAILKQPPKDINDLMDIRWEMRREAARQVEARRPM